MDPQSSPTDVDGGEQGGSTLRSAVTTSSLRTTCRFMFGVSLITRRPWRKICRPTGDHSRRCHCFTSQGVVGQTAYWRGITTAAAAAEQDSSCKAYSSPLEITAIELRYAEMLYDICCTTYCTAGWAKPEWCIMGSRYGCQGDKAFYGSCCTTLTASRRRSPPFRDIVSVHGRRASWAMRARRSTASSCGSRATRPSCCTTPTASRWRSRRRWRRKAVSASTRKGLRKRCRSRSGAPRTPPR